MLFGWVIRIVFGIRQDEEEEVTDSAARTTYDLLGERLLDSVHPAELPKVQKVPGPGDDHRDGARPVLHQVHAYLSSRVARSNHSHVLPCKSLSVAVVAAVDDLAAALEERGRARLLAAGKARKVRHTRRACAERDRLGVVRSAIRCPHLPA